MTFDLLVTLGLLGAVQVLLCVPILPVWVPHQDTSGSSLSTFTKDTPLPPAAFAPAATSFPGGQQGSSLF